MNKELSFEFPDGSIKKFPVNTTPKEIAHSISPSLAKQSVGAKLDENITYYDAPLKQGGKISFFKLNSPEGEKILNNTVSGLLKSILKSKYPKIEFGKGGPDKDGLFLDTNKEGQQVSADELPDLKIDIKKLIKHHPISELVSLNKQQALKQVSNDSYQTQLIKNSSRSNFDFYKLGDNLVFSELPVLANLNKVNYFELLSVAGAYWEGKSSNPMLQRIYGAAFAKEDELKNYLKQLKEAKERDHRVIGKQLELFFVDPKVGAGLPYWLPNGATIRRVIERYIVDKEIAHGYQHVYTPVLANLDLYKQSGHWQHYKEDMFPPMEMDDKEMLELRPMNCPSHIQIYKHKPRSYKELPLRIAELGMMHRYEKSGALSGLQRVREMTLNDGHTFVTLEQIQDEFKKILNMMMEVYKDFNIDNYTFRLSYRDPKNKEKYFDDDEMWNKAQSMLKGAMDELGLNYVEAEGEAAFYGPKLDVQTKTALGNEETLSTIQLDFMLPEKFDLHYIGKDGKEHRPVMIHRGIVSTMERFTAYLIEMYKGAFPTWLAPVQVNIIPVSQKKHGDYARKLSNKLKLMNVRSKVDEQNEKMGYLIRDSQTHKIPYTIVVGDEEVKSDMVSVRKYGQKDSNSMKVNDFVGEIMDDISNYSRSKSPKQKKMVTIDKK